MRSLAPACDDAISVRSRAPTARQQGGCAETEISHPDQHGDDIAVGPGKGALLVYATDAAVMTGKVRVVAEVPTATPIAYPIALIESSRNRSTAEPFANELGTQRARSIFSRYGFSKP